MMYCSRSPVWPEFAWAHTLKRSLPEIIAISLWWASSNDWGYVLLPVLIRLLAVVSVAIHGLGHAIGSGHAVMSRLRHYQKSFHLRCLAPFVPALLPGGIHFDELPEMSVHDLSGVRKRIAAISGPIANGLLIAALACIQPSNLHLSALESDLITLAMLMNFWILISSFSDYQTFLTGIGGKLYCGNFGVLAKRKKSDRGFLPSRFKALAMHMGDATDIRGQQAGGMAVLAKHGQFVGCKIVNDKRGNLTLSLLRAFRLKVIASWLRWIRPLENRVHLVAHYRYGTSSGPSILETHWHRWMKPRKTWVWSVKKGLVVKRRRLVSNLITHNGDFVAWSAPSGRLENKALGIWLGEILGQRNMAIGDSPKIAGMIDLLCTQGQWDASIRLGFALLTGQAMSKLQLDALSKRFDYVFRCWLESASAPINDQTPSLDLDGCVGLSDVYFKNPKSIQKLSRDLWKSSLSLTRDWSDEYKQRRQRIIGQAVQAFFQNDLNESARLFMQRAEGTFGLVTTSSLEPGAVCLVSDKQSMFVAADPAHGVLAYASEAAALRSTPKFQHSEQSIALPYRFDLYDGDIVLLKISEGEKPNLLKLTNLYSSKPPVTTELTDVQLKEMMGEPSAMGWITQYHNPYINPRIEHGRDRVLDEMSKIPEILSRIDSKWKDTQSLNYQTAKSFTDFFMANASGWQRRIAQHRETQLSPELDLLLLGVEGDLHMAKAFCEDLQRVFPYLRVQAVDAVAYCENPQNFAIGKRTMTLAMSHSGQTFNTVDAVKFIRNLYLRGKAGPVFVMTGEVDTMLSGIVGQSIHSDAKWCGRIFVTQAGWRTAEPATVSSVAIHATLTRLLLHVSEAALQTSIYSFPPFGFCLSGEDLAFLEKQASHATDEAIGLLGKNTGGSQVNATTHAALKREGKYLSRMLTEPAIAFICAGVHLFFMLWLGWNPVEGLQNSIYVVTQHQAFGGSSNIGRFTVAILETGYFLFASSVFVLIIRWYQDRPLWDRAFTGRSIVIGDTPYVKNLISQYVSKLFSEAYEFSGFAAIYHADPRSNDLLHGYGHRITRGTLLYIGLPDGRWPGMARAAEAVRMSCSQARSVNHINAGATVIGIGHHPDAHQTVDRFLDISTSSVPHSMMGSGIPDGCTELVSRLHESRFLSLYRLIGAYVVFHEAASRTSQFINRLIPVANLFWTPVIFLVWFFSLGRVRAKLGYWDISRSQSGTLIATTAAPAPAISMSPDDYQSIAERVQKQQLASRYVASEGVMISEDLSPRVSGLIRPN